ncbi:MAG TPA: YkgJ family cysteine cluster protein [Planctomycetota bacterium]|nr:YkgJ family cysteine cluster protein [Planctomycetota bacterium]
MPTTFDCQTCGACCCNSDENRAEGYPWYVEVEADSKLLARADLQRRYVVFDPDAVPHLRLDADGRCAALLGRLGNKVRCSIYAQRPRGCRRVQPGDAACRRARRERGLEPA